MTDLRKAAEMALEALEDVVKWYASRDANENLMPCHNQSPEIKLSMESVEALRQALSQPEQEPVAWDGACILGHCDSPSGCETSNCCRANYCTPVDAVNMRQERVDETAKREHEPVAFVNGYFGGYLTITCFDPTLILADGLVLYTAPPKQEWDGPTDEEYENFCSLIQREEAKLKEKNT